MFAALPADLKLGQFQEPPTPPTALAYLDDPAEGIIKQGVEYR
jgi:hypothetical protein